MPSKALEANIAQSRVDVTINSKYQVVLDVMSRYYGLRERLNTFLKELCHPYKNWKFIVNEARTFSLSYFYELKTDSKGPEAARIYIDVYTEAIETTGDPEVIDEAFKNLYLFLQKIMRESGPVFNIFQPVLDYCFNRLHGLPEETLSVIAKNYYKLNRLGETFLKHAPDGTDFRAFNSLMTDYLDFTYSYWLSEPDPVEWLEKESGHNLPTEISGFLEPVCHGRLENYKKQLDEIISTGRDNPAGVLEKLVELPGFGDIVGIYKGIPEKMDESITDERLRRRYMLIFLFQILNSTGLSNIHEESLREINRIITWLISNEDFQSVQRLIRKTFSMLKENIGKFPDTVLVTVLNVGKGVYKTDESDLVKFFNHSVVQLGFQTPDFRGMSHDWQIQGNVSHIHNIRTWMELIKLNPKWSKTLLSSLIINLSLYGVLIKDTDLFPRDITGFLNSDLQPVYNLVKQLMRLFPAYFNEIGAEGSLRDISTQIDEMYRRKDILVHFLRKQSHVESSSKIISLIETILEFWRTGSKEGLRLFLPADIYEQIATDGPYINGVHKLMNRIFTAGGMDRISDLLSVDDNDLKKLAGNLPEKDSPDMKRIVLAVLFYKLLNQKYSTAYDNINGYINQLQAGVFPEIQGLKEAIAETEPAAKLNRLLDYMEKLKKTILSPESFAVREDIFRKRHIAAGIPSMYGSYHEAKFDALGLTFRLETSVNILFEELIGKFDLDFITHGTFYQISDYLKLFSRALNLDGISTNEFNQQIKLLDESLKTRMVTFTQYVDIFRGFSRVVSNIVSDYFNNVHRENLQEISGSLVKDKLLPKYHHNGFGDRHELFQKVSEIFLRDTIAASLSLQKLDLFLTRILNTLYKQAEKLPVDRHYLLLAYNPRHIITPVNPVSVESANIVDVGNKGINILRMKALDLPVPPGFIITTEVFKCRELIDTYSPANRHFREQVFRELSVLETLTGKSFGVPENALLVSVRSGGVVSMPGMMETYLNVGINESIVRGIIKQTGREWFAWDCYRRFLQSYGMSFGLERDSFDAIINKFKKKYNIALKRNFSPARMKEVSIAYKAFIESRGIDVEESPEEQLYIAIQRILNSWNSAKARSYRRIIGISDDWGTSVTVQSMVFGNISQKAGSGVLFTHSPKFSTDVLRPWGDYTIGNQGEDVVSGLVQTYPISVYQARMENRPVESTLEKKFPDIYRSLREYAKIMIYENQWSPQDIEFTFEGPDSENLYLLQTRDMEMRERKKYPSFESTSGMAGKFLGHGIGVSGGAMSGRVVFSLRDIARWRESEPATPLILIRRDTVPDDIKEISAADGLLTARGGATSHAAIVANRLDKTCIAGCTDLVCMENDKKFFLNNTEVKAGEFISIDGAEGSIYLGILKVKGKEYYD